VEQALTVDLLYPGMDEHRAIEFLSATNDGTAIDSWHWLMERSATSFYIKSMNRALQGAKVTIHGPDERHPGEDHYRLDVIRTPEMEVDPTFANRSARAGGRWLTDPGELPRYFTGRCINDNVDHVVRFSNGHDVFVAGAPAAGGSDRPKPKASMRGLLPIPADGRVVHVDVFLSYDAESGPYWPGEESVLRAQRSGLGFMTNSLGWKLSVVVYDRAADHEPDPCGDYRGDTPVSGCYRGYAATVDHSGLLWLCEKLIPFDDGRP
jgi:hypothetical protein